MSSNDQQGRDRRKGLRRRAWSMYGVVSIIVDYQERRSVPGQLERLGATVIAQRLEVGDYVLSPRVGVERKTAFDFVTAIIKKRFYLQVERLREAYPRPLYIIEGRQIYGLRDVHLNFVRGALAALTVDFAIPTLLTHGPDDTAALLFLIARPPKHWAEDSRQDQRDPRCHILRREVGGVEG